MIGFRSSCPPIHRFAPIMNTERASLRAIRHKRRKQIGELGVPTVLARQSLYVVSLTPTAWFAETTDRTGSRTSERVCAPFRGIVGRVGRTNQEHKGCSGDT